MQDYGEQMKLPPWLAHIFEAFWSWGTGFCFTSFCKCIIYYLLLHYINQQKMKYCQDLENGLIYFNLYYFILFWWHDRLQRHNFICIHLFINSFLFLFFGATYAL